MATRNIGAIQTILIFCIRTTENSITQRKWFRYKAELVKSQYCTAIPTPGGGCGKCILLRKWWHEERRTELIYICGCVAMNTSSSCNRQFSYIKRVGLDLDITKTDQLHTDCEEILEKLSHPSNLIRPTITPSKKQCSS